MSVLRKIAAVFGFGPDDAEFEDNLSVEAQPQPAARAQVEMSKETEDQIFAKVVEIFNAAQPSFIAQSMDPDKQRAIIYQALDESIKSYLSGLKSAAQAECQDAWDAEKEKLLAEAQALKKRAEELEAKGAEIKERQISADRQKRALADRVRDLESQVMKLEAEKEQLEIENKCMVNKTKAAAVLESEIEELRSANQELRVAGGPSAEEQSALDKLRLEYDNMVMQSDDLKAELSALRDDAKQAEVMHRDLQAQLDAMAQEKTRLEEALGQTKLKDQMSDAMLSDLQRQASEAKIESKSLQEKIDAMQGELLQKDARIDDLQKLIEELKANAETDDDDDSVSREELEAILKQVEMFEGVKAKMDARVEKFRSNLQSAQKEIESLRLTIRNNLLDHAQQQKLLLAEIAQLKSGGQLKEEVAEAEIGPIDELLSGTDWMVATPPQGVSMRVEEDKAPFGYQPPQKKPKIVDNDAQMSLFD